MNKIKTEEYIMKAMTLKLDAIQNLLKSNWPSEYQEHFDKFPRKLYKYAKVNKNYLDSIKNDYIYLCLANKLDDQFECRFNFEIKKINENPDILIKNLIEGIVDMISDYTNPLVKSKIKEIALASISKNNELDYQKMKEELLKTDYIASKKDIDTLIIVLKTIYENIKANKAENFLIDLITKAFNANTHIGIGSLTENKNSQVMWEMYGNNYNGICIEYDFVDDINAMINILPVIYKNKNNKHFIMILVEIVLDSIIEALSNGKLGGKDSLKKYVMELFLVKYKEWSFQKEWRAVGEAAGKLKVKKISGIYLGKNISKTNKNKVINLARKKGIAVYEQIDDMDSLSIKYKKIK